MTMKSAFHPLLGDKVFGWMGDAIDALSATTSIVGVCTTLGFGAQYLSAGLHRLVPSVPDGTGTQVRRVALCGLAWHAGAAHASAKHAAACRRGTCRLRSALVKAAPARPGIAALTAALTRTCAGRLHLGAARAIGS